MPLNDPPDLPELDGRPSLDERRRYQFELAFLKSNSLKHPGGAAMENLAAVVRPGSILRLEDAHTLVSTKSKVRPCIVLTDLRHPAFNRIAPDTSIWVVPRFSCKPDMVFTPESPVS